MSDRYRSFITSLETNVDRCAGLELLVEDDGGFSFAGVPPEAGFRERFRELMLERGVIVEPEKGRHST
jgi:hypothetical protein